jgi:hypothetical protein
MIWTGKTQWAGPVDRQSNTRESAARKAQGAICFTMQEKVFCINHPTLGTFMKHGHANSFSF